MGTLGRNIRAEAQKTQGKVLLVSKRSIFILSSKKMARERNRNEAIFLYFIQKSTWKEE